MVLVLVSFLLSLGSVKAAVLTQRRIAVGTPIASATTTHTFSFNLTTPGTLGSIQLQYCDNDPFIATPCTAPPGLDLTGAVLSSQTGEIGFSIHASSTANNLILTRAPAASVTGPVEYVFTNVVNPSTPNNSTYIRITTYATNDASGPRTDQGGAVFATAGSFGTAAYVPPFLLFCVAVTISGNCSNYSGDSVSFGQLSPSQESAVTTQSAAATNDPTGYIIYSLGTTLTSGNNTIPASPTPSPSVAGFSRFGINLRSNNNPSMGQDITGVGSGAVLADYNTPDLFMFESGAPIAEATQATDYNVYTTTYVANVAFDQKPGVYVTTITYMAVAQF